MFQSAQLKSVAPGDSAALEQPKQPKQSRQPKRLIVDENLQIIECRFILTTELATFTADNCRVQ